MAHCSQTMMNRSFKTKKNIYLCSGQAVSMSPSGVPLLPHFLHLFFDSSFPCIYKEVQPVLLQTVGTPGMSPYQNTIPLLDFCVSWSVLWTSDPAPNTGTILASRTSGSVTFGWRN